MDNSKKKSKTWIIVGAIIILVVLVGVASFAAIGAKHFNKKGEFGIMGQGGCGKEGMMAGRGFGEKRLGFGRLNGQITAISGDNITVKDAAGDEVTVAISDTTSIYNQGKIAKQSDLKVNNSVIVSGRPNSSGIVQATAIFIR